MNGAHSLSSATRPFWIHWIAAHTEKMTLSADTMLKNKINHVKTKFKNKARVKTTVYPRPQNLSNSLTQELFDICRAAQKLYEDFVDAYFELGLTKDIIEESQISICKLTGHAVSKKDLFSRIMTLLLYKSRNDKDGVVRGQLGDPVFHRIVKLGLNPSGIKFQSRKAYISGLDAWAAKLLKENVLAHVVNSLTSCYMKQCKPMKHLRKDR